MEKLFSTYPHLEDYLIDDAQVRTITAHVMPENKASAKVLSRNGFVTSIPTSRRTGALEISPPLTSMCSREDG